LQKDPPILPVFTSLAPFTRRRLRLLVLWLLAGVLPLQGMTAAAFTMLGPAHTHEAATQAQPLRLVDFRRHVAGIAPHSHALEHAAMHETATSGHAHASAAPQRHWHAHDDAQVLDPDDASALQRLDNDDGHGLSASLATVLAWVPSHPAWAAQAASAQRACAALWAPSCGAIERLERPPRLG
jgi:hypothetical protein